MDRFSLTNNNKFLSFIDKCLVRKNKLNLKKSTRMDRSDQTPVSDPLLNTPILPPSK